MPAAATAAQSIVPPVCCHFDTSGPMNRPVPIVLGLRWGGLPVAGGAVGLVATAGAGAPAHRCRGGRRRWGTRQPDAARGEGARTRGTVPSVSAHGGCSSAGRARPAGRRVGGVAAVVDTHHERPDPVGRRRHPAAPHHPHQRQAARAGGQQADPVLRDRGHGRGRHHRHRHHRGRHPGRDHDRGGRRLRLGRPGHLHRPGRPAGAGPLRAHRPGLPRRRRLRDVPGRQHAAAGPGRVHRPLRGGPASRPRAHPGRRHRRARRPDPAVPGARPAALRCGRGRRRGPRGPPGREARGPAVEPGPGGRVPVHPGHPRGRGRHRALRRGASWRSPTPSSGSSTRATGCATRWSTAGGSTPARRIRCSRATAGCSRRSSPASTASWTTTPRSTAGWSSRRAPSSSTPPCGARPSSAPGTRLVNSYIGPFTAVANDCEIVDSEIEQSVVLEHSRIIGVPRLSDSLMGKYVEVRRSSARPRRHPPHAGRPLQRRARVARSSRPPLA